MVLPEIRFLQAAIVLAEELNYSRAAERLHIEQSTLSKRILELEAQIDLLLFERTHQVVELTEAGRHFVEEARSAVLHAERAVHGARAASRGTDEVLNIGRCVYADPYLVTMIQSIRLPLFPNLKIKLWSHFSHELARMVAAGRLDLALVTAIPDTPSLTFLTVAEAPIHIALPKSDAIDHSTELCLEDLRAYDWILPASHVNPHLLEMIQTAATAKGIVAPDTHYIMTAEEASGLVLAYKGAAFLTRDSALRISSDEIAVLPLAEERLKLVTRLAMRSDDKKRLTSEFVRAAGRKMVKMQLPQQGNTALADMMPAP
jgi:DNA-binding transcriptional LysR family regulator